MLLLGIETSCDESAVAILRGETREVLTSQVASQIALHREYGGVVPEVASRNHLQALQPLVETALREAGVSLDAIDAFAATRGPGLASALMVGAGVAKGLALGSGLPYYGINHMEGHLLSPFLSAQKPVAPSLALIVSGGHTLLVEVRGFRQYRVIGRTRDDAAGEAFDKIGKMLGLPYPAGPEVDRLAREGDRNRFDLPRSMMRSDDFHFSFSGLKTAARYRMPSLTVKDLADFCASFQEAIVEVLVTKTVAACHRLDLPLVAVSGGVACNARLREALEQRCAEEGIQLLLPEPWITTDNAAMIAHVGCLAAEQGAASAVTEEIDPNLAL